MPIPMMKCSNIWAYGGHSYLNYHILCLGPQRVTVILPCENIFNPTSKVPIVYNGLNTFYNFKVSSKTLGNLLTITSYKFQRKKFIINFQNTLAQNIYYFYKRVERGHNEEILDQNSTENQQDRI